MDVVVDFQALEEARLRVSSATFFVAGYTSVESVAEGDDAFLIRYGGLARAQAQGAHDLATRSGTDIGNGIQAVSDRFREADQ